jgi:hypothetical protein
MSGLIPFEQSMDDSRARRYLNAEPAVVTSREVFALMKDIEEKTQGPGGSALAEAMEEASFRALKWIFLNVSGAAGAGSAAALDMKAIVEEHFRLSGLGKISLPSVGTEGGRAELMPGDRPGAGSTAAGGIKGYLAGAFAAMTGRGLRSFRVTEEPGGAYLVALRS